MFCFVSLVRYSLFKQWVRFLFYKREWKREMSAFIFSSLLLSFLQKKWKRQEFWMYLSIYVWWLWKYLLLYVPFGSVIRTGGLFYFFYIYIYIYIFFFPKELDHTHTVRGRASLKKSGLQLLTVTEVNLTFSILVLYCNVMYDKANFSVRFSMDNSEIKREVRIWFMTVRSVTTCEHIFFPPAVDTNHHVHTVRLVTIKSMEYGVYGICPSASAIMNYPISPTNFFIIFIFQLPLFFPLKKKHFHLFFFFFFLILMVETTLNFSP